MMKKWLRENPRHAIRGLLEVFRKETAARIHLAMTVGVIGAGFFFRIDPGEWVAVILAIGLVITAECFNTAIESLADAVHPEHHPLVGRAKDIASGGVLMAAIAAVTIGLIVFAPKLISWLLSLTSTSPAN
jgi:diacylglycerol kinase